MKIRNSRAIAAALLVASASLMGTVAVGEIVVGSDGRYAVGVASANSQTVPQRGAKDFDVLQQFGEPSHRNEAVGTPPVYSWEYPAFEVYFESGVVIHTVTSAG